MSLIVEKGRPHRIIRTASVKHIECECGFTGYTHSGDCPNCHAKEIMPQEHASLLASHRSVLADPKATPSEREKSLNHYNDATTQSSGGAA